MSERPSSAASFPPLKVEGRPIKISVFSPTYKHAQYLRQSIEAILNQTYPHFEFIIVNDGSPDETHEIVSEYVKKDSRIRYHRFEKNKGMQAAFEHGYGMATGDLVYPAASDDYLTDPTFFDQAVRLIQKIPNAAGVFARLDAFSLQTNKVVTAVGNAEKSGYISPEECRTAFLKRKIFIPGTSSIWRKDLIDKVGGYPSDLGPQHDYFINHALPGLCGVLFIPKVVATQRIHMESYHAKDTFKERTRHYAMAEKKFRGLKLFDDQDESLAAEWREHIINELLAVKAQNELLTVLKYSINIQNVVFWSYVPEPQKSFFKSILTKCEEMETQLPNQLSWAESEFKRIVGR